VNAVLLMLVSFLLRSPPPALQDLDLLPSVGPLGELRLSPEVLPRPAELSLPDERLLEAQARLHPTLEAMPQNCELLPVSRWWWSPVVLRCLTQGDGGSVNCGPDEENWACILYFYDSWTGKYRSYTREDCDGLTLCSPYTEGGVTYFHVCDWDQVVNHNEAPGPGDPVPCPNGEINW
jgi:hypothetical protein